jgi:GDP-L-fucose synthase
MYDGRRVLVAGGTGTIGIPLVRELISLGSKVRIASLETEKKFTEIFGELSSRIDYKRLDLTEMSECLKAVDSMDYVFNLVGIKGSVGIGETKVASYLLPMLRFQSNLIEASYKANVQRFLFTGSVCSYPQSEMHFEENMWNGMPKQNDRIPGIAKRVGELLGEAFELEYGWDAVRVVRPSNVYGPYDDFNPETAQVIPSLIHKVVNSKGPVKVWGDGSAIRDFIYSDDVAHWMIKTLELAPSNYPINIGNGIGLSIRNIANTIVEIANPGCELQWEPTGPVGDPIRVMSMARAESVIGFHQRTALIDGITRTVNWYKNQQSSYL